MLTISCWYRSKRLATFWMARIGLSTRWSGFHICYSLVTDLSDALICLLHTWASHNLRGIPLQQLQSVRYRLVIASGSIMGFPLPPTSLRYFVREGRGVRWGGTGGGKLAWAAWSTEQIDLRILHLFVIRSHFLFCFLLCSGIPNYGRSGFCNTNLSPGWDRPISSFTDQVFDL